MRRPGALGNSFLMQALRDVGPCPLTSDTRGTGSCGSGNGHLVVMKDCPPEFEADAVAL
ncbi:hypothetical protein GCM10010327_41600 [Streptomyces nitrosporeus]|nr:hypothetical protein GCM10010327_41600 [Streptomyces nitrosporeus]